MEIRYFSESRLDKLDRLMAFLAKKEIPFTAHWIGPTKDELEYRRKRMEAAGKQFDSTAIPLIQLTWFG